MKKFIFSKELFTLCLLLSFLFVHFENYYIYISLFLLMIIYNESQTNLLSVNTILLLKILPIYYYLVTFYSAYLKKDLLFWDNQYLFNFFRCGVSKEEYFAELSNTYVKCQQSIGFGPVSYLVKFENDPWTASLIAFLFLIIFKIILIIKIDKEDLFLLVVFLISPAFKFLILSLNSDIFIVIYIMYLTFVKKFEFTYIDVIVITIFIQLKYFPIGLVLGFITFKILYTRYENLTKYSLYTILNLFILVSFYFIVSSNNPRENSLFGVSTIYAPVYSFGFVADFKAYMNVQLYNGFANKYFLLIFVMTFIIGTAAMIKSKILLDINLNDTNSKLFLINLPMVLIINLFANYGYKFVFNFILIFIIFKNSKKAVKYFLFIPIILNPLFYLMNFDYAHQIFDPTVLNASLLFTSRLSFYFLNLIYLFILLKFVSNYLNNKQIY